VNCRITEASLRSVCRELLSRDTKVSHRALREVLRERFGAARARFEHEQPTSAPLPSDVRELRQRLAQAELFAEQMKTRAEIAELREQSHQDHWALEVDRLREQLRAQPNYAREVRALQGKVLHLTAELSAFRRGHDQQSNDGSGEEGGPT
jgi:RecG-like helicase